jgi:NAD(P)-dependent dehydrogenase (short-subunit alcohol dehydrogenase family)
MGTITGSFDGETVIVTGASSGIGRAVALAFGRADATVINADVRPSPKDTDAERPTHETIRERGGEAEFVETDVSDPAQLDSVVDGAREFGGVDAMINNAGVHVSRPFREVSPEDLETVHGVNTRGVFFGTQAAAEDMIDRDEPGAIVNTASTTADDPEFEHSHYAATKGAIRMITRSAALELAQHGIRVNSVAPGPIAPKSPRGGPNAPPNRSAPRSLQATHHPCAPAARRTSPTRICTSRAREPTTSPANSSEWTAARGSPDGSANSGERCRQRVGLPTARRAIVTLGRPHVERPYRAPLARTFRTITATGRS